MDNRKLAKHYYGSEVQPKLWKTMLPEEMYKQKIRLATANIRTLTKQGLTDSNMMRIKDSMKSIEDNTNYLKEMDD